MKKERLSTSILHHLTSTHQHGGHYAHRERIYIPDANIYEALADDNADFFVRLSADNKIDVETKMSIFGVNNTLLPIKAAALYGATKCFKYFLLNNQNIDNCEALAVAGGSYEIVRILEQNGKTFSNCALDALLYRQDDIFDWITQGTFNGSNFNDLINVFSIKAMLGLTKQRTLKFDETAALIYMAEKNLLTKDFFESLASCKYCF